MRLLLPLALLLTSCRAEPDPTTRSAAHDTRALQADPPPGPHQELFVQHCSSCHSARYALSQPRFPRKTWTAVVTKMRTTYGAPLDDEASARVVDYLVATNGSE